MISAARSLLSEDRWVNAQRMKSLAVSFFNSNQPKQKENHHVKLREQSHCYHRAGIVGEATAKLLAETAQRLFWEHGD